MNYNFIPPLPPPVSPYNWMVNNQLYNMPPYRMPPHQMPPPYFTNFPPPPLLPANKRLNLADPQLDAHSSPDRLWIKSWANRVHNTLVQPPGTDSNNDKLKIPVLKDKLKLCSVKIKELERLSKCLSVLKKSLSEEEWNQRKLDLESKKNALKDILEEFTDTLVANAETALKNRRKKRLREKLKRVEKRKRVQEAKLHREFEHKRIDLWLEKMKDEVERAKREEGVKREADLVLSEVTQKKNEARRMISLLNALNKLRSARVQTLTSRGEEVSQQEMETFNQVTEKLKKYWVDQLRGYNLEEQGLRVMLNDAEVERSDVELNLKKRILYEWKKVLFGENHDKTLSDCFEPQTLEELISLRYSWDKYVCTDNMILASSIPIGWVIPSEPSDDNWASLLQK